MESWMINCEMSFLSHLTNMYFFQMYFFFTSICVLVHLIFNVRAEIKHADQLLGHFQQS